MKHAFTVKQPGNTSLILIFAGWAMDATPFQSLRLDGCDIAVVWDYRELSLDTSAFSGYSDIYLFAWSFGVYVASVVLKNSPIHPTVKIAVNGTLTPVSDHSGIPEAIFRGTLENLSPRNLEKFYRRMCADSSQAAEFMSIRPERDIDELREELEAIGRMSTSKINTVATTDWDRAVISSDDRIFPPANLRKAWHGLPRIREIKAGHLPKWQNIIEQEIIDKRLVAKRFLKSASTYDENASVQRHISFHLWHMWHDATIVPPLSILEAGYGTGLLSKLFLENWRPYRVSLWDLAPQEIPLPEAGEIIKGDAERLIRQIPDSYYEAVASSSAMQWFDSPQRWLRNAIRVLTPGGILAVSSFGPDNFNEVSGVTQLPLRYYTLAELSAMLPDGCRVIAADEERITLNFDSPRDVLAHLKSTGVNSIRGVATGLAEFIDRYPAIDGKYPLTYNPIYMIVQKNE